MSKSCADSRFPWLTIKPLTKTQETENANKAALAKIAKWFDVKDISNKTESTFLLANSYLLNPRPPGTLNSLVLRF